MIFEDDENDCTTLTVKGVLRRPPRLAGYTFRIELGIPRNAMDQVCDILASVSHEHIIRIHGRGEDFLVTSFWNETLKAYLQRIESKIKENQSQPCSQIRRRRHQDTTYAINLWRSVALPATKALAELHSQNITLGGMIDLNSIVLVTQTKNYGGSSQNLLEDTPQQVYLRDFTKSRKSSFTAMDQRYASEFLAEDTFQIGSILSELSLIQPLPSGGPAERIDEAIDLCCHSDPCMRPTIVRIQKLLVDVLRHPLLVPVKPPLIRGKANRKMTFKNTSRIPRSRSLSSLRPLSLFSARRQAAQESFTKPPEKVEDAIISNKTDSPLQESGDLPELVSVEEDSSTTSSSSSSSNPVETTVKDDKEEPATTTPASSRTGERQGRRPLSRLLSLDSANALSMRRRHVPFFSAKNCSRVEMKKKSTYMLPTEHSKHNNTSVRTTSTANTSIHRNGRHAALLAKSASISTKK